MVTWFKNCFDIIFDFFKKCPKSVNNFRTEHLGGYFWDFRATDRARWTLVNLLTTEQKKRTYDKNRNINMVMVICLYINQRRHETATKCVFFLDPLSLNKKTAMILMKNGIRNVIASINVYETTRKCE